MLSAYAKKAHFQMTQFIVIIVIFYSMLKTLAQSVCTLRKFSPDLVQILFDQVCRIMAADKRGYQENIFLISPQKHLLWVQMPTTSVFMGK